jgi:cellulose biosynthesis protein BcsQ
MTEAHSSSTFVTFYSYKGGVGRSMALAHVAWILASRDTRGRVLVVDWDLEAPGMAEYLGDYETAGLPHNGVVDLFTTYIEAAEERLRSNPHSARGDAAGTGDPLFTDDELTGLADFREGYKFQIAPPGLRNFKIDFMPAGKVDPNDRGVGYARKLYGIDWERFQKDLGGDRFLAFLRKRMAEDYDFVLIDSRTGRSDTALMTATKMSDAVVLVFTANNQNIENTAAVARQINDRTGGRVRVLPVPARVEMSNLIAVERFRMLYERRFRGLVSPATGESTPRYWEQILIPHDARYSYVETPPFGAATRRDPVLSALEYLAGTIADDLAIHLTVDYAVWRSFLATFERAAPVLTFSRVVISYTTEDRAYAKWIRWLLRAHRIHVDEHRADSQNLLSLRAHLAETGGSDQDDRSGGTLCVMPLLSESYAESEFGHQVWLWSRDRRTRPAGRRVLSPVWVRPLQDPSFFDDAVPYANLIDRGKKDARIVVLSALGSRLGADGQPVELAEEDEDPGAGPAPDFPGEEADGRLAARTRELQAADDISIRHFDLLLQQAEAVDAQAAERYLEAAEKLARRRGDLVAVALAQYRQAIVGGRASPDAITSASAGNETITRFVEMDPFIPADGQIPIQSLSGAGNPRKHLDWLNATIGIALKRLPGLEENAATTLARGVGNRMVGEYQTAYYHLTRAHLAARSATEAARCDLELAVTYLCDERHGNREKRARIIFDHLRGARRGDRDTVFLAHLYGGLTEARLKAYGDRGRRAAAHAEAEKHYLGALKRLGEPPSADQPAEIRRMHAYRTALCYVYLADLAEVADRAPESLGRHPAFKPGRPFEPALAGLESYWPLCSLPLAHALATSGLEPKAGEDRRRQLRQRAVYALWIYAAVGLPDDRDECARIAVALEAPNPTASNYLSVPDLEPVSEALQAARPQAPAYRDGNARKAV